MLVRYSGVGIAASCLQPAAEALLGGCNRFKARVQHHRPLNIRPGVVVQIMMSTLCSCEMRASRTDGSPPRSVFTAASG